MPVIEAFASLPNPWCTNLSLAPALMPSEQRAIRVQVQRARTREAAAPHRVRRAHEQEALRLSGYDDLRRVSGDYVLVFWIAPNHSKELANSARMKKAIRLIDDNYPWKVGC